MRVALIIIVLIVSNVLANGQGFAVDSSFGIYGKVSTDIETETGDDAYSVICQADGKIIAAGVSRVTNSATRAAVVRYDSDGKIDSGFGNNGRVIALYGNDGMTTAHAVTIQKLFASAPEKIIVLSHYTDGGVVCLALSRYLPNGMLDISFGAGGTTTIYDAWGFDVVTSVNGELLVAGQKTLAKFGVFQFSPNGSLDVTFGVNGYASVQSPFYGHPSTIALQNDGKVLVGGLVYGPSIAKQDLGIVRYKANGDPDSSFGVNGIVVTSPDTNDANLTSIAVQPDGKILVCGSSDTGTGNNFILVRYLANGTIDNGFGANGIIWTNFGNRPSWANEVLVQKDDKVYAVGYCEAGINSHRFAIARYHSNGTLDSTFGLYGKDTSNAGTYTSGAWAATITPEQKVIAAGFAYLETQTYVTDNFALIRYLSGLDVGIVDLSQSNPPVLYPNPVTRVANLSYELAVDDVVTLRLMDVTGRTVQTFYNNQLRKNGQHDETLRFNNTISSGYYFLQLNGSKGSYTVKLQVQQ